MPYDKPPKTTLFKSIQEGKKDLPKRSQFTTEFMEKFGPYSQEQIDEIDRQVEEYYKKRVIYE